MVRVDEANVAEKGRVGPGQMIAVDLAEGRLYHDRELKDLLAARQPFGEWVKNIIQIDSLIETAAPPSPEFDGEALRRRQLACGRSMEDLELILHPMIEDAKETTGSMGDDTPVAVLSEKYRGLHHFFRQNFSQVTNPPVDSLRERRVMTIKTRLGNLGNILGEDAEQCDLLQLDSPVLLNAEFAAMRAYVDDTAIEVDCTFEPRPNSDASALREALIRIQKESEDAIRGGCVHIVLSDKNIGPARAPIPMILATGAVHIHLVRQHLRTFTSLNVRCGECLDVHYFAVLVGVGATTVNAYLAEETIAERQRRGLFGDKTLEECLRRYKTAVGDGLLKIMSKMGISVISSYRGGYTFEAVGLSRALVAEFFPGMPSRISGIGLAGIERQVVETHAAAFDTDVVPLPVGGFYRSRRDGELHAFEGQQIHMLQSAVASDSFATYKRYSQAVGNMPPIHLRDLWDFEPDSERVSIDEVQSITEIRKRFVTGAMSHGALSREAHETLAIAMNRIGAKSDCGEGGESSAERFHPRSNGDNANSSIKQVASGPLWRDGRVSGNNCRRDRDQDRSRAPSLAKADNLPGFKVSAEIAANCATRRRG